MSADAFVIDLDGVVLTTPVLPLLATQAPYADEMAVLMDAIDGGRLRFERSLHLFVRLLQELSVEEAQRRIATISLEPHVLRSIEALGDSCFVVTSLPRDWVAPVIDRLPCQVFSSTAVIENAAIARVDDVIDKAAVVRQMVSRAGTVVAVGSSTSDASMLESADLKVVYGFDPPGAIREVADYLTPSGKSLWNLLTSLS